MLTSQQVGDLWGVSRPTVRRLIDVEVVGGESRHSVSVVTPAALRTNLTANRLASRYGISRATATAAFAMTAQRSERGSWRWFMT
jgi:hypothetical protein